MTGPPPGALAALEALLEARAGLRLHPDAPGVLRVAWAVRYAGERPPPVPPARYLELLQGPDGEEELRRLLPLVLVGKTGFFRDGRQLSALAVLLPGLLDAARARGAPLAIWSAGCATGEEPYTVALLAAEAGAAPGELELLATDVNPEAVAATRAAAWDDRRMADVPEELRALHFERHEGGWAAGPGLRRLVGRVEPHNLAGEGIPLPRAGAWDAILCRNVLIYFEPAAALAALDRLRAGLAPGGWLLLGAGESLFGLHDGFALEEVAGSLLYRRPRAP